MLRIFTLILFANFASVDYAMNPVQRLNVLKDELNGIFGLPANSKMCTVVVTRTPTQPGPSALISHNEFEQVMRLLYASCVYPGNCIAHCLRGSDAAIAPEYANGGVQLNGRVGNVSAVELGSINAAIQQIGQYFVSNHMQKMCKFVIFNEMFFSQISPLDSIQKDFINNRLSALSIDSPYTIFYPNFLYTEHRRVTGHFIHNRLLDMQNAKAANKMIIRQPYINSCERHVNAIANDGQLHDWNFLVNETCSINSGRVLTKCKKHGYYEEADQSIANGTLYDSGVGHDEAFGGVSPLQTALLHNITIDICLDLNLAIRRNGVQWTNPVIMPQDSNVHIVQSNSIDPFYSQNAQNLPTMRGVIHADKYPHPSWNSPGVNRPQDIFFPYYDGVGIIDDIIGFKSEFHLRFVDNDYRFTFLKI